MAGFWRPTATGILLHLRVTPNAAVDRIEGAERRDDGAEVLRVRVRAVPDGGRANAAVIALLAKSLGVPKSAIGIAAGASARLKTLAVEGDPAALAVAADRLAGR